MSDEVFVQVIPNCDLCSQQGRAVPAEYDAATTFGPWAYLCGDHFQQFGYGLGTGRGQRLLKREAQ